MAAAVIALFFSSESMRSYWQKKKILNELQKKLDQVRKTNKNLSLEVRRLESDPRAIEQIARRELGLIQPGEIEYRFVVRRSTTVKK